QEARAGVVEAGPRAAEPVDGLGEVLLGAGAGHERARPGEHAEDPVRPARPGDGGERLEARRGVGLVAHAARGLDALDERPRARRVEGVVEGVRPRGPQVRRLVAPEAVVEQGGRPVRHRDARAVDPAHGVGDGLDEERVDVGLPPLDGRGAERDVGADEAAGGGDDRVELVHDLGRVREPALEDPDERERAETRGQLAEVPGRAREVDEAPRHRLPALEVPRGGRPDAPEPERGCRHGLVRRREGRGAGAAGAGRVLARGSAYSPWVLLVEALALVVCAVLVAARPALAAGVVLAVSLLAGVQGNAFHRDHGMLYGNTAVTFVVQTTFSLLGRAVVRQRVDDGDPHVRVAAVFGLVLVAFAAGGAAGFVLESVWSPAPLLAAAVVVLGLGLAAARARGPVDPEQTAPTP